jgi:hypothetical protein
MTDEEERLLISKYHSYLKSGKRPSVSFEPINEIQESS